MDSQWFSRPLRSNENARGVQFLICQDSILRQRSGETSSFAANNNAQIHGKVLPPCMLKPDSGNGRAYKPYLSKWIRKDTMARLELLMRESRSCCPSTFDD
ncbi:hypothetical protein Leryth_018469 [Lithospermum erythrorhizon]|nr:hypothetical protein Leryth_018469 [Lithospermum erythrorhizon]